MIENKINRIENALLKGHLVNNRLQIVKKQGIKWAWIKFTQHLVKLFSTCTHQTPWKAYQPDSVMKALQNLTKNNQAQEIQNRLKQIESLLFKRPLTPELHITPEKLATFQIGLANLANDLSREIMLKQDPVQSFSISPVSIVIALGMYLHAVEEDAKPLFIEKIGLKGMTETESHQIITKTVQMMSLPADFKEGVFEIAQGIGHKTPIAPAESLMDLVKNTYKADLIKSDDLMTEVNKWVDQKTHNRIPTILDSNDANLVLLNAIYLAFQWKDKFNKPDQGWEVKDFTCLDGTTSPVSMMTQKKSFPVYQSEHFDMLEKPYLSPEGRNLSQLIFLPKDPAKLNDLEKDLNFEMITDCRTKAEVIKTQLSMPKIKAESKFDLTPILEALGFPISKVDQAKVGRAGDQVSVLHKTFVLNDEKGSEAAAVTAICVEKSMQPLPVFEFNINRPYSYFIMDGNTVLFRGRVIDGNPLVKDEK